MGAGTYYTNKETGTKAFWIDIDNSEEDFIHEYILDDIYSSIESFGFVGIDRNKLINGLFEIIIEPKYYGDGYVIRMEPHTEDDERIYYLALANHNKHYSSLGKKLKNAGYNLRIATSGYTSTFY